jgi:hypothetical protein
MSPGPAYLAWHGGWVEPDALRASLVGFFETFSAKLREMAGGADAEPDVDQLAKLFAETSGRSRLSRLMRGRLRNRSGNESVGYVIATLGLGGPLEWHNHDPNSPEPSLIEVMEEATGIARARTEHQRQRAASQR